MIATALVVLLLAQAADAPTPAPANSCLPDNAGFLSMRLRGSIEADVSWRAPELDCTGMPRPDGRGLRLRFSGKLEGGQLAIVFAAPELAMGVSARAVPVNVTLLDDAGKHIYGTQGDSRCVLDEVEQHALDDPALPPHSFRVEARGFCTAPARAIDGDGAVLLTRFDFSGLVSFRDDDGEAITSPVPAQ